MVREKLENLIDLEDLVQIIYRKDVFESNEFNKIIFRHIDIEYCFGEYFEVAEDNELFSKLRNVFGDFDLEKDKMILFENE